MKIKTYILNENIIIETAELEDFENIYMLLKELWSKKEINKKNLYEIFQKSIPSEDKAYLVAKLGELTVGFIGITFSNSLWQEGKIGYISELIVQEDYRGIGIGYKLIEKAVEISKNKTCKLLELDSGLQRKEAHIFYENCGFIKHSYHFIMYL